MQATKPLANTVSGQLKAMNDAKADYPKPPAHVSLRPMDWNFWNDIMAQRPKSEWDGKELTLAAQLAHIQADIEIEQKLLSSEGRVLEDPKTGKMYANPRASGLDKMITQELSIMRSLRLTGSTIGDQRGSAGRLLAERQAGKILADADADGDGLLAT